MKMRVSIARALVTRPKILLMDEPFAALDEITRTKLNDELLQLFARQGLTVIFVTHSVYESVYLSSRIVVMTTGPGRVTAEIPIDVNYPRLEEFRTSPLYNERCRLVSAALRRAMSTGDLI
jgi:NitT/TauT family transport system ATP-binding protein